jgi:hypothetical protein
MGPDQVVREIASAILEIVQRPRESIRGHEFELARPEKVPECFRDVCAAEAVCAAQNPDQLTNDYVRYEQSLASPDHILDQPGSTRRLRTIVIDEKAD